MPSFSLPPKAYVLVVITQNVCEFPLFDRILLHLKNFSIYFTTTYNRIGYLSPTMVYVPIIMKFKRMFYDGEVLQ